MSVGELEQLAGRQSPSHSVVHARVETQLRVRSWQAGLSKLGIQLPDFVVHDFGLLLALPRALREVRAEEITSSKSVDELTPSAAYHRLVVEFSQCQACQESDLPESSDEVVIALLARLLGRIAGRESSASKPANPTQRAQQELAKARLYLLALADSLDVSTLRLLGMLAGPAANRERNVVDLLAAFASPEARAISQFSLQILPSVLETKRKPAASEHAAFGYAGLSRRGSIDSLVLTELCWDEPELMRRLLEGEVQYYAREQAGLQARRVHHLLIDASASMRGQRTVFARGTALATAEKLLIAGDDVNLRFFDSRLYEAHNCQNSRIPLGHLLAFKGEHGRNPARVFKELLAYLKVLAQRDTHQHVVQIFTHAALYIPRSVVQQLGQLAPLLVVFMLPSRGKLELDYLDLLQHYWVVDEAALAGGERAQHAARILAEVGKKSVVNSTSGEHRGHDTVV